MLLALSDGRALPMSMLASEAGVAPSTASEHLAKLTDGGLLRVRPQGRRRYFELASTQVAEALDVLSQLAPNRPPRENEPAADPGAHSLRLARTCYDHLAGSLGVAMMGSFISGQVLTGGDGRHQPGRGRDVRYELTDRGQHLLDTFGVRIPRSRRQLIRYCVDWTQQRHHLGGALGAALLKRLRELDWVRSHGGTRRALLITERGHAGFAKAFGIETAQLLGGG
jgi:hypothetical protein